MDPINATPAHLLMRPIGATNGHSIQHHQRATASAIAGYGFGPIDAPGHESKGPKPATGMFGSQAGKPSNLSWITQVQSSANTGKPPQS